MKKFEAIANDCNTLFMNDTEFMEVSYVITANDIDRAAELLANIGENPNEYELMDVGYSKDQSGNFFPENIYNAKL